MILNKGGNIVWTDKKRIKSEKMGLKKNRLKKVLKSVFQTENK